MISCRFFPLFTFIRAMSCFRSVRIMKFRLRLLFYLQAAFLSLERSFLTLRLLFGCRVILKCTYFLLFHAAWRSRRCREARYSRVWKYFRDPTRPNPIQTSASLDIFGISRIYFPSFVTVPFRKFYYCRCLNLFAFSNKWKLRNCEWSKSYATECELLLPLINQRFMCASPISMVPFK